MERCSLHSRVNHCRTASIAATSASKAVCREVLPLAKLSPAPSLIRPSAAPSTRWGCAFLTLDESSEAGGGRSAHLGALIGAANADARKRSRRGSTAGRVGGMSAAFTFGRAEGTCHRPKLGVDGSEIRGVLQLLRVGGTVIR